MSLPHYLAFGSLRAWRCWPARRWYGLLLKNPMSTTRIPQLLELFPRARFVFIVRDPYEVFASTRRLFRTEIELLRLREAPGLDVDDHVVRSYRALLGAYLADRKLIPAGQLVEVRYEELERDPLGVVRQVYAGLDLGDPEPAMPGFRRYLDSVARCRRNEVRLDHADLERVSAGMGFALQEWGYRRRP